MRLVGAGQRLVEALVEVIERAAAADGRGFGIGQLLGEHVGCEQRESVGEAAIQLHHQRMVGGVAGALTHRGGLAAVGDDRWRIAGRG